jgi:hypothetical protein
MRATSSMEASLSDAGVPRGWAALLVAAIVGAKDRYPVTLLLWAGKAVAERESRR